jgi:hypothetical protein
MEEPSRGAFINGDLVYNDHIYGNDDTVRQVESINDLQTHRRVGIRPYSRDVARVIHMAR